jgi:hypothetical protein
VKGNVKKEINQYIKNSFYSYLHLLSTTSSICIFFFFTSSHRFGELHCSSAIFGDPRVPREYLLAVTSGRIAVVRTKVLVSSSLSINRSNRLACFGYRFQVLALCVCRSTFASTFPWRMSCVFFVQSYLECTMCLASSLMWVHLKTSPDWIWEFPIGVSLIK